jgi:hypothetical protein
VSQRALTLNHKIRSSGIQDLTYLLDQPFPAESFVSALKGHLEAQGWEVPERDPLNPGLGPKYLDWNWAKWKGEKDGNLRDWHCIWVNNRGELVKYVLRYERPSSAGQWSKLKVSAVYWPANILPAFLEQVRATPTP